jgi:D-alanyl-D-alanine-carboxypeptidase/D-alanyl-D-alanine-endopeptidase
MYSTANDMTRWLEYLLDLPGVPVHQDPAATATYIQSSDLRWTQGLGRAGVPNGIGLGWVRINQLDDPGLNDRGTIIEKTGGGAGFTTYIALNPRRHIGIFVAAADGRHVGADIFRGSNDLLVYLAGLTPVLGESDDLAGESHRSEVAVRDATVHKHHKNAERPRLTRQIRRTSAGTAGQ